MEILACNFLTYIINFLQIVKFFSFYFKGKAITLGSIQSNDNLREVVKENLVSENDVIVMQFLNFCIRLVLEFFNFNLTVV